MNNADMPAMPVEVQAQGGEAVGVQTGNSSWVEIGLTKREQFCLQMGVAETGDEELDAIIRKGNEQKAAMHAMQGLLASNATYRGETARRDLLAKDAIAHADELLKELERTEVTRVTE